MALTDKEWQKIYDAINKLSRPAEFVQGTVVKRDTARKLIWIRELFDQPIPLYTFDYKVTYLENGERKRAKVEVIVPEVGEIVLVALQYGTRRLPKCLGVLRSTGFVRND